MPGRGILPGDPSVADWPCMSELREIVVSKLMLELVARTGFRMAEDSVSRQREPARVPRDHLSQPVHPSAWSLEKRADWAPSVQALASVAHSTRVRRAMKRGRSSRPSPSRERPAEIEDRAIPGHWEGDLISGTKNSHIVSLVERHSRFTTLIKVPSKETTVVVDALSRYVRNLPASLRRSLTWDRGHEMAQHKTFSVATDVKVYFCDPQSPWQRGTNENTNRLLRQYLPKKTDLSLHTQEELDEIALRLNQRPRKTLEFQTPTSKLQESVASTL